MIKKILTLIFIFLFISFKQICIAANEIKITDFIFDNSSKMIFLPSYNTLDEVEKISVESKSLNNPKRTFFDISNSILTVGSIVYHFKNSPVEKVILAQNSTNPNVVRLTFYHKENIDLSKAELLKLKNGLVLKLDEISVPNSCLHRSFREEKSLSSDFIEKLTFLKQVSNENINNGGQKEVSSTLNNPTSGDKPTDDVLKTIFIPDETKRLRSKSYIQKLSVRNGNVLLNGIGNITVEKPIILSNPSRIAFDLSNAVVSSSIKNKTYNISADEKVVISQFEPTKVRVVIFTNNVYDYESVFSFDLQSLLIVNKNRISNVKLSDNISKLSSFTVSNYNVDDKNLTFEFNNPCVFSFKRNSDKVEFVIYNGNFSDITKIKTTLTNSFGKAKVISYGHSIIKVILSINPNAKTEFLETTNGKKATILIKNKMLKPQPIVIPKEDNIEETIKIPKNADKRLIVLDAGHGGSDVGATRNGIYEKDINLDVTNRLARMLTKKGFKVVLTRKEDSTVSLQERVEISNAKRPILFMSVHVNASVNETVRGVETHYWKDNSLKYANIVQKHLSTVDSPARGVVKSKFYVINHTEAPAVLVEIGFISNAQERNELVSEKRKEQTAKVLADAIVEYLKTVK